MGSRYLYPAPSPDVRLLESHLFGLVVRESLFTKLGSIDSDRIRVDKLLVLDAPKDGLGILLHP
jgi:hypothetical protein